MKCEIIKLTPEIAKQMLLKNPDNRRLKTGFKFFSHQMKNGEWKENGEAIIIDKNGNIRDGQHRLTAVVHSGYSYNVPLISGVDPDVMDTIDTGFNRSLSDVLSMNGFLYHALIASILKKVLKFQFGQLSTGGINRDTKYYVSNNRGLHYAFENKDELLKIARDSEVIYIKQLVSILTSTEIAFYLHLLGGYNYKKDHIDFVKMLTGQKVNEGNAAGWVFRKLASFKKDQQPVNTKWKVAAIIKAWNLYVNGDIPVNRMKINLSTDFDKILSLK